MDAVRACMKCGCYEPFAGRTDECCREMTNEKCVFKGKGTAEKGNKKRKTTGGGVELHYNRCVIMSQLPCGITVPGLGYVLQEWEVQNIEMTEEATGDGSKTAVVDFKDPDIAASIVEHMDNGVIETNEKMVQVRVEFKVD